jgi:cyclic beta-1,2-glucan synthetase
MAALILAAEKTKAAWLRWRHGLGSKLSAHEEAPLRADLFSSDQMAAHGAYLAQQHTLDTQAPPDRLLAQLDANEVQLAQVGKMLSEAVATERAITPAAEWLLDNLYLIEEEIRTARRHLPKGYSRELPRLTGRVDALGGAGQPRVHELALQAIAHADGRLSRSTLSRFVAAYQSVQPLKLGELWAFPIMLRLALIDNLRRVSVAVAKGRAERDEAAAWAARMLQAVEERPSDLILVIADMARARPALSTPFVAEFARRLQGQGASLALPLTWVEQRLSDSGQTIEQMVHLESQTQAAAQVSVANSIGSLRLLGSTNWPEFVETLSNVEQTLRQDPLGIYGQMDFGTRDAYRHAVESIARRSGRSEAEVAQHAIDLADLAHTRPTGQPGSERQAHVGYFLLGSGRRALEQALGLRVDHWWQPRQDGRLPLRIYLGVMLVGALLLAAGPFLTILETRQFSPWALAGLGVLVLLATGQLSMSLVNWMATLMARPQTLPRLDFSLGITPDARTLVVVPTMLGSAAGVEALVEALELRFLANRDPQLQFALLTDLHDADAEQLPQDDALVALASARIEALNAKYGQHPDDESVSLPFLLLHRPRRWNPQQRKWMGWERKRGKLAELNALLRGRPGAEANFSHTVGDISRLGNVRYVITLDTDTQLPRGSAVQLVASMAHPLNRPRFGSGVQADVVVEGYGILQPRVGLSLPSTGRSGYARLHGGEPGIDPYTRAVSDVYQDLFGEGSFIGKGIYDVDAFERALGGRLPENRVLSHDLLEGCYARSGLLSDVQLMEEAPLRYSADVARRHRWIRGDWQLLGWLRKRLHGAPGAPPNPPNPLSPLARWKLLDNLRRSFTPVVLLALLLVAWLRLPEPGMWTLRVLAIMGLVPLAAQVLDLLKRPLNLAGVNSRNLTVLPFGHQAAQLVQALACLPFEALYSLHAIAVTLWRTVVTRRGLLDWTASAEIPSGAPAGSAQDLLDTTRRLWVGPLLAVGLLNALVMWRPDALPAAAPVLLLWLASPLLVWWIDRPLKPRRPELSRPQQRFLRHMMRRTWFFFDTTVGIEDNFLPPDNVQEHPVPRVAHRTSPTNIGFALLANLTAHDLGYITLGNMLGRIGSTLDTLEQLERYKGHFYNWYDTQSLEPLRPRYVSSVDSGNLMAQLITLRAGLLTIADQSLLAPSCCEGVRDTYGLMQDSLSDSDAKLSLQHIEQALDTLCARPVVTLAGQRAMLDDLHHQATELLAAVALQAISGDTLVWAQRLVEQCRSAVDELAALLPPAPPVDSPDPRMAGDASLRQLAGRADATPTARQYLAQIEALAARAGALSEMDQSFLYDSFRHQLVIGHNVDERASDTGYYDLLASEARLGVFVAIAQGQLPQESWFALGRQLSTVNGEPVLMSWSGSMFEYLMPMLLMPNYGHTLLDQSCLAAVQRQIDYGRERGVPWGISESGYNATDAALNYQYRAFGVPGLGLKRGLAEDLVIAPYATMMALLMEPAAACGNLQRLVGVGASGAYGFYEAVDYTPSRLPRGQTHVVVRSYMAHHQGMGFLAMAQVLRGPRMQRPSSKAIRACRPRCRCCTKKCPRAWCRTPPRRARRAAQRGGQWRHAAALLHPPRHAHARGAAAVERRYHVMLTQSGGGYSRCKDLAADALARGRHHRPLGQLLLPARHGQQGAVVHRAPADAHRVGALPGDLHRWPGRVPAPRPRHRDPHRDRGLARGQHRAAPAAHQEHQPPHAPHRGHQLQRDRAGQRRRRCPASGLQQAVRADRDRARAGRGAVQPPPARVQRGLAVGMFQLLAVHGARGSTPGEISHETDRARFIGRGGSLEQPLALRDTGPLSNSAGSVLDPGGRQPLRGGAGARSERLRRPWCWAWPTRASSAWAWPRNTATGAWRSASSNWPGRTARWCSASSTSPRPKRSCSRAWPAR